MKTIKDLKFIDFKIDIRKAKTAKTGLIEMCNFIESKLGKDITLVEIGSYAGISSSIFAQFFKTIHCIDPFLPGYDDNDGASKSDMIAVEKQFDEVVSFYNNIKKIKMKSVDASKLFENNSIDVVYIDGEHTYNAVKDDIKYWLPKIKKNGIICGHDYQLTFSGTIKAVDENFKDIKIFPDTSWLYCKE